MNFANPTGFCPDGSGGDSDYHNPNYRGPDDWVLQGMGGLNNLDTIGRVFPEFANGLAGLGGAVISVAGLADGAGAAGEGGAGASETVSSVVSTPASESAESLNIAKSFNPFVGKTAPEIDEMLLSKGYSTSGRDPINGFGGYVNPRTGRSIHIDPDNSLM